MKFFTYVSTDDGNIQLPGFGCVGCILFDGLDIYCIVVGSYFYVLCCLFDLWDIFVLEVANGKFGFLFY